MKRFHVFCSSHATGRVANRIFRSLTLGSGGFPDCSSRITVGVSFLPHSSLCSISEITSPRTGIILQLSILRAFVRGRSNGPITSELVHLAMPNISLPKGKSSWPKGISNPAPLGPESYALLLRHTGSAVWLKEVNGQNLES